MKSEPKKNIPWKVGDAQLVHRTPYFDLCSRRVRTSNDYEGDFYFVRCTDWVKTIPITPAGEIVFIRQFRPHIGAMSLEIPGGAMDADETDPLNAAKRELIEETGYTTENLELLGTVSPNTALFSNTCWMYIARNALLKQAQELDVTENIAVELIPIAEVRKLLLDGKIQHGLVAYALSLFLLKSSDTGLGL